MAESAASHPTPQQKLIVALDYPRLGPALAMARQLLPLVQWFKIGVQLFTAEGPGAVERLAALGAKIFLDLKFHDIPHTVAGAVSAAADLPGVELLTVHALGGVEMMRAAMDAIGHRQNRPRLLAVTVLTSLDRSALRQLGFSVSASRQAIRLARLACQAGLDGLVCSPQELRVLRRRIGPAGLLVVPGIRTPTTAPDDQARHATAAAAIRAGADYLVVGRPITRAPSPATAAAALLSEIESARRPS